MAGDPNGDWSRFTRVSGSTVNLVAIGDAPSAILDVLIPGGGTIGYDVINIVGDMRPLVDNNLVDPIVLRKTPGTGTSAIFSLRDPNGRARLHRT
jgi:putative spermidine/putrescine transport system substrate-binding protein